MLHVNLFLPHFLCLQRKHLPLEYEQNWLELTLLNSSYVILFNDNHPTRASLIAQSVKNLSAMQKTWVRSLGQDDPLEKEMAAYSSILAWRLPWTEEPGGLQSMASQRDGHDLATQPPPSYKDRPYYLYFQGGKTEVQKVT